MSAQNKELKKLKAAELLRRCGEDEEAIRELLPLLNAANPKITAEAYYNLGLIAEQPEKGRRNIPQAIEYYQKAIELGYPDAADDLGRIYYYNIGVKRSIKKAVEIWRKGFEAGSVLAGIKLLYHLLDFTKFNHFEVLELIDGILQKDDSWSTLYYRKYKIYADQSWDGYNIELAIENLKIYAEHSPEFGKQELDKLYNSGKHKIPKHLSR
jgi:TPR repeat protein